MQFFFLLWIFAALSAGHSLCPKSIKRSGCLTDEEVKSILSRWPTIYDAIYSGSKLRELARCTVTADFHSFDRTLNYNGPFQSNRSQLIAAEQQANKHRTEGPNIGKFSSVSFFHSCDKIAWRWQFEGHTTGKTHCTGTTNTIKGLPVKFYGIDLLSIQKGTQLIEQVVTSADYLDLFFVTGQNFNGTPVCPETTAPSPDPSCSGSHRFF